MTRVYLHAAGLNAASWGSVPGMALDLPGHGAAPRAASPTVAAYAQAVLPHLPPRAALIGHSLGGMVGLSIAARWPDRVTALVLIDVPVRVPFAVIRKTASRVAPWLARVPGPRGIAWMISRRVLRRSARPDCYGHMARMTPAGMADAMVAAGTFDGRALLGTVQAPMLALVGARSILTRGAYRAELRRAVPQVQTRVLEAGHQIPFDCPDAMHGAIDRFLESQR